MSGSTKAVALACALGLAACDAFMPSAPLDEDVLDGTIEGMTASQVGQHIAGDEEFGRVFAVADGLGPIFVAASCEQCHAGDGKGHPAFSLVRFGRPGIAGFDPMPAFGGPQLQHRSIPGYPAEAVPQEAVGVSTFNPPAVTGLGFLDAVDDATLIALADPNDMDGDGISGRLQLHEPDELIEAALELERRGSPDPDARGTLVNGRYIGRFGKKALTVNLLHQTVGAYQQDMGVTSDLLSEDLFNPASGSRASDSAPDPEVSSATVANVVFYLKTLRVPSRRDQGDADVLAGQQIFADIGCVGCHVPTLMTGASEIEVLDRVEFHPYTDLLLHDMGPELDDGYTEGRALTSEWRTPPLWGIGLQDSFQGGQAFFMHDGRARTLDEAILLHGGEASGARTRFSGLSAEDQARLIRFLESL
ncbi:MAG: thiol oxidoreductase [Gemmatimonadota bacterium]|nr:thiol oxidoreductase [Gemmatimonadota bacterium]MDE3005757.1 thiol oxidoreductase [Gemmatimonadota bacterium]